MARRFSSFLFAIAIAIAIAFAAARLHAATLDGVARVVDGDTIAFGSVRVRIWGIDAPEARQACQDARGGSWCCGVRAGHALASWLARRPVSCRQRDRDDNGRPVAACTVDGQDVGAWLVGKGWAFDYPRYSRGRYAGVERLARSARRNIFAGAVTPPWVWRAEQRQKSADVGLPPPSPACPFKGNINTAGRRIVHAPGQRDYATVRIDPARGERWFCSLADARAAGWRPAAR